MLCTCTTHNSKNYNVTIDGDNSVNIISKSTIEKMGLKPEPHLQLYITWVDKNVHSIIQS